MRNNSQRTVNWVRDYMSLDTVYQRAVRVRGEDRRRHLCVRGEHPTGKHWIDKYEGRYDIVMWYTTLFRFYADGRVQVLQSDWNGSPTTVSFRNAFNWPPAVRQFIRAKVGFTYKVDDNGHVFTDLERCVNLNDNVGMVEHRLTLSGRNAIKADYTLLLMGGQAARDYMHSPHELARRRSVFERKIDGITFGVRFP